jgi:Flp pilus assembly protein TadB
MWLNLGSTVGDVVTPEEHWRRYRYFGLALWIILASTVVLGLLVRSISLSIGGIGVVGALHLFRYSWRCPRCNRSSRLCMERKVGFTFTTRS